jgi:arylamine N-acetyltransferase
MYKRPDAIRAFCRKFSLSPAAGDDDALYRAVSAFAHIPYENLTKIIRLASGREIDQLLRGPEEVIGGYLAFGTGGTCYSMTNSLRELLRKLGIDSNPVTADRTYGEDTHCCLIVERGGTQFLLDPGFLILRPVELPEGRKIIETPVNKLVIQKESRDRFTVSTLEKDGERFRYLLKTKQLSDDQFLEHWKRSFSFPMMKSVLITSVLDNRQVYLHNSYLQFTRNGSREKSLVTDNYERSISRLFGISEQVVKRAIDILGPDFLKTR